MPDYKDVKPLALPRVKQLIKRAGMTQEKLAEAMELDRVSVNRSLNGKQNYPMSFVAGVADVLREKGVAVTAPELLGPEFGAAELERVAPTRKKAARRA